MFHDLFHIHHQGYKQIEVDAGLFEWYSRRVVTAKNWRGQNPTLPSIIQRIKDNKQLNKIKAQEIEQDQDRLEKMTKQ